MLSERQETILELTVDAYLESGRPVGSKAIAEASGLPWSASTIRAELAALEAGGYLIQPHTSAGRVPTDRGYRHYVEAITSRPFRTGRTAVGTPPTADKPVADRRGSAGRPDREERIGNEGPRELSGETMLAASVGNRPGIPVPRQEVEDAMREATAALARVTDLLALVVAPPPGTATIHRVEALLLQPDVVMVIVIASSGDVTRRTFTFDREVDPGLVKWASSYLNETLSGIALGSRRISARLAAAGLGPTEGAFIEALAPALTDLEEGDESTLYVEGAARLLDERRAGDLPQLDQLMAALEERAAVLSMMRSAIDERSVFLWIGAENPQPELRNVSVVGANYGLGHRNLGSVGVVGPTRMDYENTIRAVTYAARELSRYFEHVYA